MDLENMDYLWTILYTIYKTYILCAQKKRENWRIFIFIRGRGTGIYSYVFLPIIRTFDTSKQNL